MTASPALAPFTTFAAVAVPIDIANCDTDQIIPARFLRKSPADADFGETLLHDLRFDADGQETDFVLNQEAYRGGRILVADINWGCGSSRESAVKALVAFGVRAVIAPSFGDIHYNNCIKNGILPIRLPNADCAELRRQLRDAPGAEIAIDLPEQSLTGPDQAPYAFDIEAFDKHRLVNGLDEIRMTLGYRDEIDAFAASYRQKYPWS